MTVHIHACNLPNVTESALLPYNFTCVKWYFTSTLNILEAVMSHYFSVCATLHKPWKHRETAFIFFCIYVWCCNHGNARKEVALYIFYFDRVQWRCTIQCQQVFTTKTDWLLVKMDIHISSTNQFENLTIQKKEACQLNAPVGKITQPKREIQDWGCSFIFWNLSSFWNCSRNSTLMWIHYW